MNHPDLFRSAATASPHHPCLVQGNHSLTFHEVDARADQAASAFQTAGLSRGDRVAVLAYNELEYVELQIAAQRAGITLAPLNYRLSANEIQELLDLIGAKLLIHGPETEEVAERLATAEVWHLGADGLGTSYQQRRDAEPARHHHILDPTATATILFTSGTTGPGKAAMISNRALLARTQSIAEDLKITASGVLLQALPMFHATHTISCAFASAGATNVLVRKFEPENALAELHRHRATHALLVPTVIKMLLNSPVLPTSDMTSLEAILYGGSSIPPHDLQAAVATFGCDFYQLYGLTEAGLATMLRPEFHNVDRPALLESAGTEMAGCVVEIVDQDGAPCSTGATGEILITSPGLMTGYWGEEPLGDLPLRTGDLGHRDEHGFIHITGRSKDVIITGGENVSAREVEHALLAHPKVADCAVIGLAHDDLVESVHAVLVPADEQNLDLTEIDVHCRGLIAGYKRPRSYSIRAELPRTALGKVAKAVLVEEEQTLAVKCPSTHPDNDFDIATINIAHDAASAYATFRVDGPVVRANAYGGYWAAIDHATVRAVAIDTETFCSGQGSTIPSLGTELRPIPVEVDPPEHLAFRRLLVGPLRPEDVGRWSERIRVVTNEVIDDLLVAGQGDLMEIARAVPPTITAEIMGIPDGGPTMVRLTRAIASAAADGDGDAAQSANAELVQFLKDQVDLARDSDRTDLLAIIANSGIPRDDAIATAITLAIAGQESTVNALGSMLWLIGTDHNARQRIIDSPALVATTVEEVLRLESPTQMMGRTATRDANVGGVQIRAGERVGVAYGAANLDPKVFPSPGRFDIERSPNPHLAFGHGIHRCVGEHLARLEMRIVLEVVLSRIPHYELTEPVQLGAAAPFTRGPKAVMIRVLPTA